MGERALTVPTDPLRKFLRRTPGLRSAVYLGASLWAAARETAGRTGRDSLGTYTAGVDPWRYDSEWGRRHLQAAEELITEAAARRGPIEWALELGCGEGWTTARLATHAHSVVAVDLSPVAIERARQRCVGAGTASPVRFEVADVMAGGMPAPGRFDLVVAMGFIELFQNPARARRVRRLVVDSVLPGGHLLVATVRQHPVVEQARWAPVLPRGASGIDRFLQAGGWLQPQRRVETPTHLFMLYEAGSMGQSDR